MKYVTIDGMIEAIAQDAYEGATENDLRQVFIAQVKANLEGLSDDEIAETYAEILGGE